MTQTIIGDIVAPRERGRYQGYIGSVFALASVAGPLLGGFFVDSLSWRYIFYNNIPLGLVALAVTTRALNLPIQRRQAKVDYWGAALLVGGVGALLLVGELGGMQYAWGSPTIIGLSIVGVLLVGVFVWHERRTAEPILPPHLFRDGVFRVSAAASFIVGAAMFGALAFLPLYLQVATGASATKSGLLLLPLIGGLLVTIIGSGADHAHRPLQGLPARRHRADRTGDVSALDAKRRHQPPADRPLHGCARRRAGNGASGADPGRPERRPAA